MIGNNSPDQDEQAARGALAPMAADCADKHRQRPKAAASIPEHFRPIGVGSVSRLVCAIRTRHGQHLREFIEESRD